MSLYAGGVPQMLSERVRPPGPNSRWSWANGATRRACLQVRPWSTRA